VPTVLFFRLPAAVPDGPPLRNHWMGDGYFPLTASAATADGKFAATGDSIGQTVLWDTASHEQIGTSWQAFGPSYGLGVPPGNSVGSITFGGETSKSDGLLVATVGEIPVQLELGIECWKERACRLAGRTLDPDEAAAYLGDRKSRPCEQLLRTKRASMCAFR
jgi:hypothetical protein